MGAGPGLRAPGQGLPTLLPVLWDSERHRGWVPPAGGQERPGGDTCGDGHPPPHPAVYTALDPHEAEGPCSQKEAGLEGTPGISVLIWSLRHSLSRTCLFSGPPIHIRKDFRIARCTITNLDIWGEVEHEKMHGTVLRGPPLQPLCFYRLNVYNVAASGDMSIRQLVEPCVRSLSAPFKMIVQN